jgi:phage terminase large subunit
MTFKPTTALNKIAKLSKPVRILQGSQGAGKTIGLLMLLINHAQHNTNKEITIFQYEKSKMKKTVMRDFIKIMKDLEFYKELEWNRTESIYTFSTGSYIEFAGLDSADIGKGFRRDIIYFNELNRGKITLDLFTQLQSRCAITYADFNPDEAFFIHTEVLKDDNAEMIVLTFEDNEGLPDSELQSILKYKEKGFYDPDGDVHNEKNVKSKYWANKWIVYGLGLPGKLDGSIYTDWEIINRVPEEATLIGSGLDFGYQDPTAAVSVYKYNGTIIVDEILHGKGLSISEIANTLKEHKTGIVYCDSAEPRSILELNRYGVKALGVKKGKGSVIAGIDILREQTIKITKSSANLVQGFKNYSWMIDSEGKTINKPSHMYSDIMDALRYLAVMKLGHKKEASYAII